MAAPEAVFFKVFLDENVHTTYFASMEIYAVLKQAIADDTGFANTLLHIHGGMLIFLLARLISGRSIGSFIPFAAVVILELFNEYIDFVNNGSWRVHDTASDIVNTLFWPLVLSIAVRVRPHPPVEA